MRLRNTQSRYYAGVHADEWKVALPRLARALLVIPAVILTIDLLRALS